MVESQKHDNDALRWREKYFSLSEEQEKTERDYADYLGVLQKALVRISLAADGQDSELDKHLSSLRELLRKEPVNKAGIGSNLKQVETTILRLDTQRKDSGQRGEESLLKLVEQLAQLNLSRDKQRALKSYGKSLRTRAEQLSAYPALLDEYSRLQREALAEMLQAQSDSQSVPAEKVNKGLLSRLFGGEEKPVETDKTSVVTSSDEPAEAASPLNNERESTSSVVAESVVTLKNDESTPALDAAPELRDSAMLSSTAEIDERADIHDGEPVADLEAIIAVLSDLLEQLPLSADERSQAEQLRDELTVRVEAGELDRVVSGAAELVLAALGKSQQDFETFLLGLDTQLAEINGFLSAQGQGSGARKDVSEALNSAIKGQVDNISQSMVDATDLHDLKTSVQGQLHSIVSSMDQFVSTENQREHELEAQLEAMQEKLSVVQNEARSIKQKLHNETLRALTDTLTRLPNREAFDERFLMERERYLRYKNPASLAILDIDHFKQVNDQHGHLVGDRVLQTVAKKMKESIRNTDFLARYGGEEFVLIMPETTREAASQVLDKIRAAVADMALDSVGSVTISAGVAAFQLGEKAAQLVERADKALYTAKDNGRNRVEVSSC
ncbi:MAG: diguanylate cyclase [Pseudomonadales bacterium]